MAAKDETEKKKEKTVQKASLPRLRDQVVVAVGEGRKVTGFDAKPQSVSVDNRIRRLIKDGDLTVVEAVKK